MNGGEDLRVESGNLLKVALPVEDAVERSVAHSDDYGDDAGGLEPVGGIAGFHGEVRCGIKWLTKLYKNPILPAQGKQMHGVFTALI